MKIKINTYIVIIFFAVTLKLYGQDNVVVSPVSFNSENREYAPVYFKNGLVFCGINLKNEAITYVDSKTNKQLSDIYFVENPDSSTEVSLFSNELKTSFHDGPITFSRDGNTAYFTRSQRINQGLRNSLEVSNTLGVYKADFDGIKWKNISPCLFNSPDYNVGQPCLSPDGKKLYVTSDMPGGYGGVDIYYAEIIDGKVGPLVNLGESVNSSDNEMFPFIDENNKLYFSSNREGGIGGLDLYSTNFSKGNWTLPVMLDTNFNSTADDFSLIFNKEETEGYFTSNRNGSDDIFKCTITYPEFNDCEELVSELLCYEFFEEATLNADSVSMIYEWDFGDGTKERALETYHCYEQSGFYIVQLNILDPLVDKNFVNEATYELEIEEIIQPKVIAKDSVSTNTDYFVSVEQGKWNEFNIKDFYVDYGDSSRIIKNPQSAHQYKKDGIKELKILITGYADSTNEILSKCFYKNIFIKTEDTVTISNLIANNDTIKLNEEKKFMEQLSYSNFNAEKIEEYDESFYSLEIMNSPTSIISDSTKLKAYTNKVTEVYDEKSNTFSYVLGKSDNPFVFIDEFRTAHKSGFDEAIVKAFEKGKITIADLGIAYNEKSGEVSIVLNDIQFEYNGVELDKKSKQELEKLVLYLTKNQEIHIELSAHTDGSRNIQKAKQIFAAKGLKYSKAAHDEMSKAYNLTLSQKRAKSVLNYLVKNGIDSKRLSAIGYGESKPIADNYLPNGDDNPEGRAKNRRVEFKILTTN